MGDQKIHSTPLPPPPADWPTADDPPDQMAKDDNVAAKVKHEEVQQKLGVDDRYVSVEQPREMKVRAQKVVETQQYRGTQPDDEMSRLARARGDDNDADGHKPVLREGKSLVQQETFGKVEQRIGDLVRDMNSLMAELEKLGAPTTRKVAHENAAIPAGTAQLSPEQERLNALLRRLVGLEVQTKQQIQLLLAGGVGLSLSSDPRLTFKRLFDRFKRWPKGVRPGHRPETDADFDVFLAWVFEPPGSPTDEELPAW